MQERFILPWSSLALLRSPRRYTAKVAWQHSNEPLPSTGCQCDWAVSALQGAAFSPWPWWPTAVWTSGPCRASGAVTVGSDGRPDGVFRWASCCPATTWAGQRSSHWVMVVTRWPAVGPSSLCGPLKFAVPSLVFVLSSRCQYVFQCQLRPWSRCSGAATLRPVPRPEVLHPPEELPLRNVPQRALLRQPRGPQVSLNKDTSELTMYSYISNVSRPSTAVVACFSVTDVSGAEQEMLHLSTT